MFQLEILGRALRWLREDRGLKQEDVAQTAGITRPMLSAYERGRVQPTLDTLDRLLRALDCDLKALSEALNIVASMGKVGRKKEEQEKPPEDTQQRIATAVDNVDRPTAGNGTGTAPIRFQEIESGTPAGNDAEEAAFRELLEVHRRWLLALRRSVIQQVSSNAKEGITPSP